MSVSKKVAPKLDSKLQSALEECATTSAKIRMLNSEGFSRGDIARILDIRYQWVRNVLITPLKKEA